MKKLILLLLLVPLISFGQTAEDYFNRGVAKEKLKDYKEVIVDYSKAIELNSDYVDAYYNRGNAKYDLKDYKEAIVESLNLLRMSQLIIFLEIKR